MNGARGIRVGVTAGLSALLATLTACSGSSGTSSSAPTTAQLTSFPSVAPVTSDAPTSSSAASAAASSAARTSAKSTVAVHPAKVVRTTTVTASSGVTYPITVWAEDHLATCQDHAFGAQMIAFLTSHPCQGAVRQLLTTKVGGTGKDVGIALVQTGFVGSSPDNPYDNSAAYLALVQKDGTGNINDLLREGYRIGSGPTKIPSPDAFSALGQDEGAEVFDLWYLSGSTPNNAPELIALAQDLFLQTIANS